MATTSIGLMAEQICFIRARSVTALYFVAYIKEKYIC